LPIFIGRKLSSLLDQFSGGRPYAPSAILNFVQKVETLPDTEISRLNQQLRQFSRPVKE